MPPRTPPDFASAEPARLRGSEFVLSVDGARPLSPELVGEVAAFCDRVEDRSPSLATSVSAPAPRPHAETSVALWLHSAGPARRWPGDGATIDLVSRWEKALRRLERLHAATIAVVEGWCGGPAFEVLLTADYRVADADATFCVPATGSDVWAGMALHRMAAQLGPAGARRLALFGAELPAPQARDLHLVDAVETDPWAHADERLAQFGALLPDELAIRRRLVIDAPATAFEDALGRHLAACHRMLRRTAGAEQEEVR